MRIDPIPVAFTGSRKPVEQQAEQRAIVQAVHAVNATGALGDGRELVFSFDRQTRRPIIRLVDRTTGEVLRQIPNAQALRLAQDLKIPGDGR
jgi:flagellar protein FlaG